MNIPKRASQFLANWTVPDVTQGSRMKSQIGQPISFYDKGIRVIANKRWLVLGVALIASCVFILETHAQQGGFSDADADINGQISSEEFKAYVGRMLRGFEQIDSLFQKLDKDQSGGLSEGEFADRMAAIRAIRETREGTTEQDPKPNESEKEPEPKKEVVEFAEQYERMFANRDPKLGDMISGVKAYDGDGNPFELDDTRGKYTVIAFGCLT